MIYLCSPYSHEDSDIQRRRFELAARAAGRLMAAGIPVHAPLSNTVPSVEQGLVLSHSGFLKLDLQILRRCDAVLALALPGWESSIGMRQELFEAMKLQIPVTMIIEDDIESLPRVKKTAIRFLDSRLLKEGD